MKPNFALNFTDDSISLLHRTARGWLEIGAAALDAPDLGEAMAYLRRSALGLAPHGVTTRLIIPPEQILWLEMEAPGPTPGHRIRQIRQALEGRTPYPIDDLVFDWSGDGHIISVAVVARDTLREAEEFAAHYRFNPISFVAMPDPERFEGEPWFGPTDIAGSLLPEDETVERETDLLPVVSRESAQRPRNTARQTSPESGLMPAEEPPVAEELAVTAEAPDEAPPLAVADIPAPIPAAAQPTYAVDPEAALHPAILPELPLTPAQTLPVFEDFDTAEPVRVSEPEPASVGFVPEQPGLPGILTADNSASGNTRPDTDAFTPPAAPQPASTTPYDEVTADHTGGSEATADAQDGDKTADLTAPQDFAAFYHLELSQSETAQPQTVALPDDDTPPPVPADIPAPEAYTGAADATWPDATWPEDLPPEDSWPAPDDPGLTAPPAEAPPATAGHPLPQYPAPEYSLHDDLPAETPASEQPRDETPAGAAGADDDPASEQQTAAPDAQAEAPEAPFIAVDWSEDDLPEDAAPAADAPVVATDPLASTVQPPVPAPLPLPVPPPQPAADTLRAARPAPARRTASRPAKAGLAARARTALAQIGRSKAPAARTTAHGRQTAAQTLVAPPPGTSAPVRDLRTGQRGKPRFLGLILTAVLLLVLAGIAAWSSVMLSRSSAPDSETETAALPAGPDTGPDAVASADLPAAPTAQTSASETGAAPADDLAESVARAVADANAGTGPEAQTAAPPAAAPDNAEAPQPGQAGQDEIILSTLDAPPPASDALALAPAETGGDSLPPPLVPPPPFGTRYELDENGLIRPTPEGIVTPQGVHLVAGAPPVVPPARPASIAARAAPSATAPAAVPADLPPTRPMPRPAAVPGGAADGAADGATDGAAADPATTGAPASQSASIVAGPATTTATTETAALTTVADPSLADPSLARRSPRARPAGLVPAPAEETAPALAPEARFASRIPRPRPASVTRAAEARASNERRLAEEARAATAAASLSAATASAAAPQGEDAEAEAVARAAAAGSAATPVVTGGLDISRLPPAKPRGFERRVQAAVSAAAAAASARSAAAASTSRPARPAATPRTAVPGEDDEPEVAAAAPAPRIPTRASVAQQATYANAINLRKINLIGVYGTPARRHALVRLGNGQYKKVSVGDRVDGGVIAAITDSEVRYQKGGRILALTMPRS